MKASTALQVSLVKSAGVEVASSGDLIQFFEATLDDEQWQSHVAVEKLTTAGFDICWKMIAEGAKAGKPYTETQVQRAILDHFGEHDLIPDHPPIVAVGPHSGDPHFEPTRERDVPVAEGELVMIDLWAKLSRPGSVTIRCTTSTTSAGSSAGPACVPSTAKGETAALRSRHSAHSGAARASAAMASFSEPVHQVPGAPRFRWISRWHSTRSPRTGYEAPE